MIMICPKCNGSLEVINMFSDHFLCDTCGYEENLDGVIKEEYNDEDKETSV